MNIAIIRQGTGRYLFSVPESIEIKEGDNVKCDTKRGITDGVAYADSLKTDENAVQLIAKLTGAKFPLKCVVGKTVTSVEMFEKPAREEPAQEPIKLYCVKDYNGLCHRLRKGEVYEWHDGALYVLGEHQFTTNKTYEEWAKNNSGYAECLIPLVSRPAKVGEWVYLTDDAFGYTGHHKGEVFEVKKNNGCDGARICLPENSEAICLKSEYLVLDGYTPEPEYYNGKVVCVDRGRCYNITVGKVYTMVDGKMTQDDGSEIPVYESPIESLSDFNEKLKKHSGAKFIEFKGE